jgi:hypothetical protein
MFLVGCSMVFIVLLSSAETSTIITVAFLGCGLILVGSLLPRLTGTIKVTPGSIELALAERLEATRREAETRAPELEEAALRRALEELIPTMFAPDTRSAPVDDAPPKRDVPPVRGRWSWAMAGATFTALVMGVVFTTSQYAGLDPSAGMPGAGQPPSTDHEAPQDPVEQQDEAADGEDAAAGGFGDVPGITATPDEVTERASDEGFGESLDTDREVPENSAEKEDAALEGSGDVPATTDSDQQVPSNGEDPSLGEAPPPDEVTERASNEGLEESLDTDREMPEDEVAGADAAPGTPEEVPESGPTGDEARSPELLWPLGLLALVVLLWVARLRGARSRSAKVVAGSSLIEEPAPEFARRIVDELVDGTTRNDVDRRAAVPPPPGATHNH